MICKVIIFDLGNVLIPFDYTPMLEKFNRIKEGLGSEFALRYKSDYEIHRRHERGDLSSEEFLTIMMDWLGNSLSREEFCRAFSDIFTVNRNVADLLPLLKRNYKLVLLSNTNLIHKIYGWENYDFLEHFDKMILSYEVKAVKPERKIYEAVQNYTGEPASNHLFIDDIKEYVEAAINCGWDAIQFLGYDDLIKNLTQRNLILS